MRCSCFVLEEKSTKGRKKRTVVSWWHTNLGPFKDHETKITALRAQGYMACPGEIKAEIRAVDEPYMGGCAAELEISYQCSSCGWQFYPQLPSTPEALSAFLTDRIANLNVREEIVMAEAAVATERESVRQKQEMVARYELSQAAARATRNEKRKIKKAT